MFYSIVNVIIFQSKDQGHNLDRLPYTIECVFPIQRNTLACNCIVQDKQLSVVFQNTCHKDQVSLFELTMYIAM
jgi:hypothetical protein